MSGMALQSAGIGSQGGIVGLDISQASLDAAKAKGVYKSTVCANLDEKLPLETASFGAIACVGVTSYIQNFKLFFGEVSRTLAPGGLFVMTHRADFWDQDERGCRSEVTALADVGTWTVEHVGEPEAHMPDNPDPVHSAKRIRLLGFRKK